MKLEVRKRSQEEGAKAKERRDKSSEEGREPYIEKRIEIFVFFCQTCKNLRLVVGDEGACQILDVAIRIETLFHLDIKE